MKYFIFRYVILVFIISILFTSSYFISIGISHSIIRNCYNSNNNGTIAITCIDHKDKSINVDLYQYIIIAILFPISCVCIAAIISFVIIVICLLMSNNSHEYEIIYL